MYRGGLIGVDGITTFELKILYLKEFVKIYHKTGCSQNKYVTVQKKKRETEKFIDQEFPNCKNPFYRICDYIYMKFNQQSKIVEMKVKRIKQLKQS